MPPDLVQASHLASGVVLTCVASQFVKFRITIQHDSLTGDVVTFSMEGYGNAAWVIVTPASDLTFTWITQIRTSVTPANSLVYLTVDAVTGSMGSLAATVSMPYNILALIASR